MALLEAEPALGGHTLTDDSAGFPVDLGFQVMNLATYPHLTAFLDALGVDTEPSDMSFALSSRGGALEWGSSSLSALFAQRRNLASPAFWGMLRDVLRFGRAARRALEPAAARALAGVSLGEWLARVGFGAAFVDAYLLPMCAAVWSVPAAAALAFPAVALLRFWQNHHLLDVLGRPTWRVVAGRGRAYVEAAAAALPDVRVGARVAAVRSLGAAGPVELDFELAAAAGPGGDAGAGGASPTATSAGLATERFDCVLLATHADVSLRLLGAAADPGVRAALAGVPYAANDVWLHADSALMPRRRAVWAAWNCLQPAAPPGADARAVPVCVSYWANRLQRLPDGAPDLFVTLNPPAPPRPDKVLRRLRMAHPVLGAAADAAQAALPALQGRGGVFLAGAWAGAGFHEDGMRAALAAVAAAGGGPPPWEARPIPPAMPWLDAGAMRLFDRFARAAVRVGRLRLVLPTGGELCYGAPAPAPGAPADAWRGRPALDATLRIHDAAFFRKIVTRHDVGLGESYMDGDYEPLEGVGASAGLGGLLAVATANAAGIERARGLLGAFNALGARALRAAHAARGNTAARARVNIEEHYDAGNAMYRLFLDPTMTYSCGVHAPLPGGFGRAGGGGSASASALASPSKGAVDAAAAVAVAVNAGAAAALPADFVPPSLEEAQLAKLDALIAAAGLEAHHHVLEIGCGWGSFALRAAGRVGCRVTGVTVSKEQLAEATARVAAAGLADKITLLFCDYRDTPALGSYDRVVSCEMIEAVGHEHLEAYFQLVGAALKPGGRAAIQVIAEPEERYEAYCASSDFIREHVFPGGHLPSLGACVEAAAGTGLSVRACVDIGPDYAVTLRMWRAAWEARKREALELGYSPRFWRKYRFYFAYCEAAFDARYIHTFQVVWGKDAPATLTAADVARSLERSKMGAAAPPPGGAAAANAPAGRVNAATQLLLALFFFLAGCACGGGAPAMFALPAAAFASAAVCAAVGAASAAALPAHARLGPERAALWALRATRLLYSAAAAAGGGAYVTWRAAAAAGLAPAPPAAAPRALAAAAAGFFAFALWAEVSARLYRRSYAAMAHFTVMLVVLSCAAHKGIALAPLAAALVGEANTAAREARALVALAAPGAPPRPALAALDAATFAALRLVPHAALGLGVLASPGAFAERSHYLFAALGAAYMNALNLSRVGSALLRRGGGAAAAKAHAA